MVAVKRSSRFDPRPASHRGPFLPARDLAQAFGNRLNDLRKLASLTIRDLADASGLPSGTVSALCRGKQQPNLRQLLGLQRGLGFSSVEELFGTLPSLAYEAVPTVGTAEEG